MVVLLYEGKGFHEGFCGDGLYHGVVLFQGLIRVVGIVFEVLRCSVLFHLLYLVFRCSFEGVLLRGLIPRDSQIIRFVFHHHFCSAFRAAQLNFNQPLQSRSKNIDASTTVKSGEMEQTTKNDSCLKKQTKVDVKSTLTPQSFRVHWSDLEYVSVGLVLKCFESVLSSKIF